MHSFSILGYTHSADTWCPECVRKQWKEGELTRDPEHFYAHKGKDENGIPMDLVDSEGNIVHPIFLDNAYEDMNCAGCEDEIYSLDDDESDETDDE